MMNYWNNFKDKASEQISQVQTQVSSSSVMDSIKSSSDGMVKFIKSTVDIDNKNFDVSMMGVHQMTDRILTMGFPSEEMDHLGRPIDQISRWLIENHEGHFMIWNLANKPYNYEKFQNHIIEVKFAGFPVPPLDQMFSTCNSLHGWLREDEANVAVIHCQTGNGRTVATLATYLAWCGAMDSPTAGLAHICNIRDSSISDLLIPTQRRYINYATSVLDGKYPSVKPVTLERVIFNGIPNYDGKGGCAPYLQIFKSGKLLFTHTGRDGEEDKVRSYSKEESSILFPVGENLEGDIFIRVRHVNASERVSMLRFGFHTGFIRPGNTRYVLKQLDGACDDERFPRDFFLDLIFHSAVDEEGNAVVGKIDPDYWSDISKKPAVTVEQFKKDRNIGEQKEEKSEKAEISGSEENNDGGNDQTAAEETPQDFDDDVFVDVKKPELEQDDEDDERFLDEFMDGIDPADADDLKLDDDDLIDELEAELGTES